MAIKYGSLPFAEAIAFFRDKLNIPTETWDDLWQQDHDIGFMVAGAMKAELLDDFRQAVDKAIADGTTLTEFRKDFDTIIQRHGWDYNGSRGWRSRLIYETNLRSAYQAGRWSQIQAVKETRPYLQYKHSDSVTNPRPQHVAWDGLVISTDDPWWQTHYPPNGWGCRCRAFALNERDLQRLGKTTPDPAPSGGSSTFQDKQGNLHQVPDGIDPGWAYAPGASRVARIRDLTTDKANRLDATLAAAMIEPLVDVGPLQRWMDKPEGFYPLAALPEAHARAIGANSHTVLLSGDTLSKQQRRHKEIEAADYQAVQAAIDQGERIQDGQRALVYIHQQGGRVVVVKTTVSGDEVFLTSLRRLSNDQARRDSEIRRLRRKG